MEESEGLGKMGRGVDIRGESSQNREVSKPVPTKKYFLIFSVFLNLLVFVLLLFIIFFSSVFSFNR